MSDGTVTSAPETSPRQYEVRPKTGSNGDLPGDLLEISMGPSTLRLTAFSGWT